MKLIFATVCLLAWFNSMSVSAQNIENLSSKFDYDFDKKELLRTSTVSDLSFEKFPKRIVRQSDGVAGARLPRRLFYCFNYTI